MATQQLSADQVEQIRRFIDSEAADLMFAQIEAGIIADWIICDEAVSREDHWRRLQSILHLKNTLRDTAAMKRLTERAQERRVYQT